MAVRGHDRGEAIRSFGYLGLVAFVAAYYERVLGASPALGNAALAAMLFGGAAGTLLIGPLADRFGRRAVVAASMAVVPPSILGFMLSGAYPGMALLALPKRHVPRNLGYVPKVTSPRDDSDSTVQRSVTLGAHGNVPTNVSRGRFRNGRAALTLTT